MRSEREQERERDAAFSIKLLIDLLTLNSHSQNGKRARKSRLCRRPLYAYTHTGTTQEQANFKHATSSSTKFILLLNILKKSNTHTHTLAQLERERRCTATRSSSSISVSQILFFVYQSHTHIFSNQLGEIRRCAQASDNAIKSKKYKFNEDINLDVHQVL